MGAATKMSKKKNQERLGNLLFIGCIAINQVMWMRAVLKERALRFKAEEKINA